MALLTEYALTPGIFSMESYSNEEVAGLHLQNLKDVMLNEALVRDLRDGEWFRVFDDDHRLWHIRGKKLLKKLREQNRLNHFPSALQKIPKSEHDWCVEALASHTNEKPLDGVITTADVAKNYNDNTLVSSIDKLMTAPCWRRRRHSVRLDRKITAYEENLRLLFECANSIMFIDPHLNPTLPRYRDFWKLFDNICKRKRLPLIEIHRVCYIGSGRNREILTASEWEKKFKNKLYPKYTTDRLKIEVFIWDDFHDRYIISDLVGISIPNGIDISNKPNDITTWARISRSDRDDIQREFDDAKNRHKLQGKFSLP